MSAFVTKLCHFRIPRIATLRSPPTRRIVSTMAPSTLKRVATEDGSVSPPPTKRKVQAMTTNKVVANFFKPTSQKEPERTTWRVRNETLLHCEYDQRDAAAQVRPRKIAAFDFDSTLITSASGKTFARDAQDWRWWHAVVPGKLQKLHAEGYLVVIISNQGGISLESATNPAMTDKKRLTDFKTKVNAVLTQLDLPISLYAATARDQFRKPRTGMWKELLKAHGLLDDGAVNHNASYFVGDAGGRTASSTNTLPKDFSCSDRDFAANVGIHFKTPEEFFLGESTRPFVRTFDPAAFLGTPESAGQKTEVFKKQNAIEICLFVGSPGAGKSSFYWTHLKPLGYQRVNQDILKTRDRCIAVATDYLQDGEAVAVDNTNADIDTRAHWVRLAQRMNVPIRCVLFTAPTKLCEHNDTVRALGGPSVNPEARNMLPRVAFSGFASRYREPTLKEGFTDVTKVDFKFEGTDEQQAIWKKFWISG